MGLQSDDNYMPTMGAFHVHWLLCRGEGVGLDWRALSRFRFIQSCVDWTDAPNLLMLIK